MEGAVRRDQQRAAGGHHRKGMRSRAAADGRSRWVSHAGGGLGPGIPLLGDPRMVLARDGRGLHCRGIRGAAARRSMGRRRLEVHRAPPPPAREGSPPLGATDARMAMLRDSIVASLSEWEGRKHRGPIHIHQGARRRRHQHA